jgi:Spy/CpxP family protein refolding chaperone
MIRTLLAALGLVVLIAGLVGAQPQPQPPVPPPPPTLQPQPPQPLVPPAPQPQPPQAPPPAMLQPQPPQPPQRPPDPIADNLLPPDLVMRYAQEIGLTDEQREALQSELQKAQARFQQLQPQVQQEVQAMAALLKEERPDTEKVLGQLDKVLAAEREMKRAQMGLMITIKSKLTAAQQTQLQELKQKMAAEGPRPGGPGGPMPPPSFQAKLQKIQTIMRQWQTEGRDLSAVTEPLTQLKQELEPLMRQQKFAEAEAVLDRALTLMGEEQK